MSVREYLNQNPIVAVLSVVAVLVIALVAVWLGVRTPPVPRADIYFVDAQTMELFAAKRGRETSPAGNQAVPVRAFACNSCDELDELQWYAERRIDDPTFVGTHEEEVQVSDDLRTWISGADPRARSIREIICPDGTPARECLP